MSENQPFELVTSYQPAGDQPQAIEKLVNGIEQGLRNQLLLGVTGSGKTYTMANVIAQTQRPTIVMAHNKTLAAQLANEFKELLPNNAVEYFVSYYDYYQPEAYVPQTDTFIEKDSSINEEVERLRHSATNALLTRRDVIVVATVSCIYGLGDRDDGLEPEIASAPVAAFNLMTLSSILGTSLMPDLGGHVVMVEEVAEHLYAIDRLLFHVTARLADARIAGFRLGQVTNVPENDRPFGSEPEEMARFWCERHGIPFLGRAEIGHSAANMIVPFGVAAGSTRS